MQARRDRVCLAHNPRRARMLPARPHHMSRRDTHMIVRT